MSDAFTTDLYPIIIRYLKRAFRQDEEAISKALCWAWYRWSIRTEERPARIWAYRAVWAVRRGRDLPGVVTNNHQPDACDHAWTCGGMGEVRDRRPRPDVQVMRKEQIAHLYATATTAGKRRMLGLLLEGHTQREAARLCGVNPHTIIEWKRDLAELTGG